MNKQFATVAVMAALCLTLVGCGGSDGPNLRPELEKLTEQVKKQTEQLEQVQDDLDTERKAAAADTQKELQEQIDEAKEATAAAERQAAEERQKAEAATAEAERKAQEQIRQQAQALEANQRARGIRAGLLAVNVVTVLPANLGVTVAKPKTLKIAASADYKAAGSPTSFTGFRSARLRSPSTLGDGFQRTLVAYTDREASRDILVHLKANVAKDDNKIRLGAGGFDYELVDTLSDSVKDRFEEPDELDADHAELTGNSFSGSLFGISGNLVCRDGNNASCPITITATDYDDGAAVAVMLKEIGTDNILYFQPASNRQIPLDGTVNFDTKGIPDTAGDALTDTKFMVFGWWEKRPDDTGVAYDIDVFASDEGLLAVGDGGMLSGTARYVGRAAGFYAETDLAADPVKIGAQTHPFVEAGEFTASVSLNVNFEDEILGGLDANSLKGTVGNFVKNNGSRPAWSVSICDPSCDDPNDLSDTNATAFLTLPGVTATGESTVKFVPDLSNDRVINGPAVGAVGTFDVGLDNVLELTGAFGAHKQ